MLNGIGNIELVGSIKIGSTEYTADQLNSQLNKNTTPIGTIFYHISSVPPEGAFLLNGQIIYNCSTLYPEFYQYVTSNDGVRKITSSVYESELSSIGICGGFVVDSENGSVRLPNICSGFIEGTDGNNVGNTIEAGLPNISGNSNMYFRTNVDYNPDGTGTGALRCSKGVTGGQPGESAFYNTKLTLDASLSNAIYGNSNTVQPKSVCYSVCIQVFNTITNLSSQESAQIISELQGKAGINLENLTVNGKDKIIDVFKIPVVEGTNIIENTLYQADKAGLFGVYYIGASDSTVLLKASSKIWDGAPAWSWGHSANAVSLNNQIGNAVIYVPKGWYYEAIVDSSKKSAFVGVFRPFENSIANS